jgi:glutamate synthase domain-containing protein 2
MRNEFIGFAITVSALIIIVAIYLWTPILWSFVIFGPVFILGFYDYFQTGDTIKRNFPIIGRGRYIMESLRPKIYQYFIESDINGRPFNRINRSIVYQRAQEKLDTAPFGTQLDVYEEGYEWMHHSIAAIDSKKLDQSPRVKIGGPDCRQPYEASVLNISAMSYGSLSSRAIRAMNGGARIGNFAHNTGEGGISPFHLESGGDLIFQFGTGYFGVRDAKGNFSPDRFAEKASIPSVKMIEIKLSQGAKPGHGGILPGRKVNREIADIRGVKEGVDVISPPYHTAFNTPRGLLEFISQLRELSNGKPIGFKLCIGSRQEFLAICKAMVSTGIKPDFIAVDGAEGGTGAAPLEFSNSVGMPYREGLAFVYNALIGYNLKKDIKIIASGKIVTGFDIFRALTLGADLCYSARAMMLALGCIQALECNKNTCPTGITTQNPELMAGLIVRDKEKRVAHYHKETVESFVELMAAAGITDPSMLNRRMISRRLNIYESMRYDEIYPYIPEGCLLDENTFPEMYLDDLLHVDDSSFHPKDILSLPS